jgi:hypothetical protein
LSYFNKPILIAHNGNKFDHKVLIKNKIINENDFICLDSVEILK